MDIVVPGVLITTVSVIGAFVINQALVWAGVEVSEVAKKGVVFTISIALTGFYGVQAGFPLPDVAADPLAFAAALAAFATLVFKSAESVYDAIWKALVSAK